MKTLDTYTIKGGDAQAPKPSTQKPMTKPPDVGAVMQGGKRLLQKHEPKMTRTMSKGRR